MEEQISGISPIEGGQDFPPENEEMPEEEKFFKDFNNEEIDNRDPSLQNNYIKIYEEEVEIRVEKEEFSQDSIFESLLCKILCAEEMDQSSTIRIEIACDKDLYFYYTCDVNSDLFEKIKQSQELTCNFHDFSDSCASITILVTSLITN